LGCGGITLIKEDITTDEQGKEVRKSAQCCEVVVKFGSVIKPTS